MGNRYVYATLAIENKDWEAVLEEYFDYLSDNQMESTKINEADKDDTITFYRHGEKGGFSILIVKQIQDDVELVISSNYN